MADPTKSRQNREYSRTQQQRAVTRPRQPLMEKQHSFGVRSLSCAREAIVHRPMVSTADGRLHPAANAADIATSRNGQQMSAAALKHRWSHDVQISSLPRREAIGMYNGSSAVSLTKPPVTGGAQAPLLVGGNDDNDAGTETTAPDNDGSALSDQQTNSVYPDEF